MDRERDNETGKYTKQYDTEDFVTALASEDFLSTNEVAEAVDCTQNLAYRRLKTLEEEGIVTSKKIGRSLAWQLSNS